MIRKPTSIRMSDYTRNQLNILAQHWGEGQTEAIAEAIEVAYRTTIVSIIDSFVAVSQVCPDVEWGYISSPDHGRVSAYRNHGQIFTSCDWLTAQPTAQDDAQHFAWMHWPSGRTDVIWLDGAPHLSPVG